ncbi:MAG TPA: hypothetical protein VH012_02740 [Acidimicrobiales bacterium]|nr:hypothetical protein [Acidimicrobiales bacterium]
MNPARQSPGDAAAASDAVPDAPILEEFLRLDPESVPPAVGNLLAVIRQPADSLDALGDDMLSPQTVRAIVTGLVTRQQAEREVFLSALGAYKDLADRLALEAADARDQLSLQTEAARLEQAQMLRDFLERLDVLTAKISTSAARYEAELAEKDVLIEDRERQAEAYAGHAANAQSTIDDIRRSTSWRLTAPVRLLSRMLAQRATPVEPEN